MITTVTQGEKEYYQCGECGFQYVEKEWAEKCEAWCREHQSCNLEITSHGTPPSGEPQTQSQNSRLLTNLLYSLIGSTASLLLFLTFYWSLRLNASISNLTQNFWDMPLYFWP